MHDVKKLLKFFAEMKAVNEQFFFDFEIDGKGRIKTYSGQMLAAGVQTKILGIALPSTQLTGQTCT
jgi:hypothetical protein